MSVFERVYEVGPVFRAEPHDTTRNLAEYVSMDVELGFIGHFRDVMALLRDVVAGMAASVRDHAPDAVHLLEVDLPEVPDEIPSVDFMAAMELINSRTDEDPARSPTSRPRAPVASSRPASARRGLPCTGARRRGPSRRPTWTEVMSRASCSGPRRIRDQRHRRTGRGHRRRHRCAGPRLSTERRGHGRSCHA